MEAMLPMQALANLRNERPSRKLSMIRLIWADITAALAVGHTLKVIHKRIVESDIRISYPLLRVYVSRLRREDSRRLRTNGR